MNDTERPLGQPRYEIDNECSAVSGAIKFFSSALLFAFTSLVTFSVIVAGFTIVFGAAASLCNNPPVYSVGQSVKTFVCPVKEAK